MQWVNYQVLPYHKQHSARSHSMCSCHWNVFNLVGEECLRYCLRSCVWLWLCVFILICLLVTMTTNCATDKKDEFEYWRWRCRSRINKKWKFSLRNFDKVWKSERERETEREGKMYAYQFARMKLCSCANIISYHITLKYRPFYWLLV